MTTLLCDGTANLMFNAIEPSEKSEPVRCQLVRGEETRLLERVGPLVLHSSVALDLACVKRIDAAGIAALVALYQSARRAGHCFRVTHVPTRIAQVLAIVGLDRFLFSHNAVRSSHYDQSAQRPAA